jgi:hypothetical protein
MRMNHSRLHRHNPPRPASHAQHDDVSTSAVAARGRTARDQAHAGTTVGRSARCERRSPECSWRRRRLLTLGGVAAAVVLMVLAGSATAYADPSASSAELVAAGHGVPARTVVLALVGSVDEVLANVRNWLMGILASLATVYLTIGGVRRVFGGGDPGEQEKAKECFKAAGIGYCLAALAPLVVTVLKGIVGA